MSETQSGAIGAPPFDRYGDHERRITALEQGVASISRTLVEVQTEGRMRGERQDRDTRELRNITEKVKRGTDDIITSISLLSRGLKFSWAILTGIGAFLAIYGDRLIEFWRHIHQ